MIGSFIKRQTSGTSSDKEWQRVVQQMTTSDNEWQRVVQRMATSNYEWLWVVQQVTMNDNEWHSEWERVKKRTMSDSQWQW